MTTTAAPVSITASDLQVGDLIDCGHYFRSAERVEVRVLDQPSYRFKPGSVETLKIPAGMTVVYVRGDNVDRDGGPFGPVRGWQQAYFVDEALAVVRGA